MVMKQKLQPIQSLVWKVGVFQSPKKKNVYVVRQIKISCEWARFYDLELGLLMQIKLRQFFLQNVPTVGTVSSAADVWRSGLRVIAVEVEEMESTGA